MGFETPKMPTPEEMAERQKKTSDEFFENYVKNFKENEQGAVYIMSALNRIKEVVRKEPLDKDSVDAMINIIKGHLESMLTEEDDGKPSEAYKKATSRGGDLKSMGKIAGIY